MQICGLCAGIMIKNNLPKLAVDNYEAWMSGKFPPHTHTQNNFCKLFLSA